MRQVDETHRPVLLTRRGRGVAVVQALTQCRAEAEERSFLHGVVEGMMDLEAIRTWHAEQLVPDVGVRLLCEVVFAVLGGSSIGLARV